MWAVVWTVNIDMLTMHPSFFQQPQNSNLPLNALGSLGSQLPCGPAAQPTMGATPSPNASASLQPQQQQLQQHHAPTQAQVPPRPSTPASTGGPSSTPTHIPSSLPGPPSAMSTPPDPSQPLTPLQPQPEPPSQMQQPTSVQAQHPSTPVRYDCVNTGKWLRLCYCLCFCPLLLKHLRYLTGLLTKLFFKGI